jgi:hypothetical protein
VHRGDAVTNRFCVRFDVLILAFFTLVLPAGQSYGQSGGSQSVTWTCLGTLCPWGSPMVGQALVWPTAMDALNARLGYSVSHGIYLPAARANGIEIVVESGSAAAYAGLPNDASHRFLAYITPGNPLPITGLAAGEVLSVQSDGAFAYSLSEIQPGGETPPPPPTSAFVTWACSGAPCPWGNLLGGNAVVWPQSAQPTNERLGYTTSHGIYLSAARANGMTVSIIEGAAVAYAGLPQASSHRFLGSISAGQPLQIVGLVTGEVVSVQSDGLFSYQASEPTEPGDPDPGDPDPEDPGDPDPDDPGGPPPGPGPGNNVSGFTTWTCTGSPCPWGAWLGGYAIKWDSSLEPSSSRLGYTASDPVYLLSTEASGMIISVTTGSAMVFAGLPNANSHRQLATIGPGFPFQIQGLLEGEVVSVQSDGAFTFIVTPPDPSDPGPGPGPGVPDNLVHSETAFWRCNLPIPECEISVDWVGSVISWPSWAAYESNNRAGWGSRTVYSAAGEVLYPYMGAWANGCEVTVYSGVVLIIEWERGAEVWRSTLLHPGQTHTINLTSPENGAMIETEDFSTAQFSVSLRNCTPQPVPR